MTSSSSSSSSTAPTGPIRLDSKSPPPPPYSPREAGGADGGDDVDDRLPSDVDDEEEYADEYREDDELLMRQRHAPEVEERARQRFVQNQSELAEFRTRFDMNRPSVWKRIVLILFFLGLTYFAFRLRFGAQEQVVHARRYSSRYKYRPAASPVLKTVLPDGRVKVRGDEVGAALQAERLLRQGRPTDAVELKGGRKGRSRKNKKEAKPPRPMSREA